MLPYLGILGMAVPVPAFTLLLGIWVALSQIEKKSEQFSLDKSFIYNLGFNALLIGLVGARITYFLTNPYLFIENPLGIISLNSDLMHIPGGLLSALIFIMIISNRKQISLLSILDGFSPGIAAFMIFYHLANFFSGNSFGAAVDLPWSIDLWNALRHPVQIYELVAALIIFFVLFSTRNNANRKHGLSFTYLVSLSALSKLFFEAFHGDSQIIFGQFRVVQLAAWIILVLGFYAIIKINQNEITVE